jgi:hypothetical protein
MSTLVDRLGPNILRDWMGSALGKRLGDGVGRKVFVYDLNPKFVIKVEESGFQNVVEHEIWRAVKETTWAKWFAPVRHISGLGSILLMERTLPAPRSRYPDRVPKFLGDLKYSNFGLLQGRLVCHDYGTLTNFLAGNHGAEKMRKAEWWDAGDGSSFDDGTKS